MSCTALKVRTVRVVDVEMKNLPEKLEQARKSAKFKVRPLCDQAGVSSTTWYNIMNEEIDQISEDTLDKICGVLGVDWREWERK